MLTFQRAPAIPTFALCTTIDEDPRLYVEIVLWVICSRNNLPANFKRFIYVIGNVPFDLLNWIEKSGVRVIRCSAVVNGSPHCNKIAPFFVQHRESFTVVCDSDLYFVQDPTLILNRCGFQAAPNNGCNPPPRVLKAILAASGLGRPYRPSMALMKGNENLRETHINNISAGIVIAPRNLAKTLAKVWKKWAIWLAAHQDLLETWAVHVDQVSFALAMEEMKRDVNFIPPNVNAVLHILDELSMLYALHLSSGYIPFFSNKFDSTGNLVAAYGQPEVDSAINRFNQDLREASPSYSLGRGQDGGERSLTH